MTDDTEPPACSQRSPAATAETPVTRRLALATSGAALVGGVSGCISYLPIDKGVPAQGDGTVIHVGPDGSITNSGAADSPLGSIHRAINIADPGDTVRVAAGEYEETVTISEGGEPGTPKTLTGPPEAVLKPPEGEDGAVVSVDSSHTQLTGLTITGLLDPAAPTDPASYHPDKLISINSSASGPDDYLENLVISPHRLGNAGQSLINSVQFRDSEIGGFEVIGPAGTKWIFGDDEGHNGEIVYLGTAPDNRLERGYETYDRTRNVRVHHIDNSAGHPHSELVDCKAGVENVTIEYCTDGGGVQSNDSYYSRAISMDARDCTIRWNVIQDPHGSCVRIGPQNFITNIDYVDGEPQTEYERQLGTGHAIYGNVFTGYAHEAVNFLRESKRPGRDSNPLPEDQRVLCGNRYDAYSDTPLNAGCPTDIPAGRGVGHLGGESPWSGEPPTRDELFARTATDPELNVTVHADRFATGEEIDVPVTVTNGDSDSAMVRLVFRVNEHEIDTWNGTVAPGGEQRVLLTDGPHSNPLGYAVTRNGQKVGSVRITTDG